MSSGRQPRITLCTYAVAGWTSLENVSAESLDPLASFCGVREINDNVR